MTKEWRRLGGREEDQLLRLVSGRGGLSVGGLYRAAALSRDLAIGDQVRAATAIERAHLLLAATETL